MSQRNGSIRNLGLLQCNNQIADIVEINYVFSIENSNLACTNAEDLDAKEPDTSYLWVDIVLSSYRSNWPCYEF